MGFISHILQSYVHPERIKYEVLGEELGSDERPEAFAKPSSLSPCHLIFAFLGGLVACVGILILSYATSKLLAIPPKTAAELEAAPWNNCGRSSKVAMELGCVMEPLFYGWMPPQCSWDELKDQFPVFEDRTYYTNKNLSERIPIADLWAGKHVIVYTTKYHDEHCLFQWRKLQFAVDEKKEWVDNKTISAHHTKHCADGLSRICEQEGDYSAVVLGFYKCRKTIW